MALQDRPLSGAVTAANLSAGTIPIAVAATTIHELDENVCSLVDLFFVNGTGGALVVTVTVNGGTAIALSVAANTIIQFFDAAAFRGSNVAGAGNLITASCPQAGVSAFGRVVIA